MTIGNNWINSHFIPDIFQNVWDIFYCMLTWSLIEGAISSHSSRLGWICLDTSFTSQKHPGRISHFVYGFIGKYCNENVTSTLYKKSGISITTLVIISKLFLALCTYITNLNFMLPACVDTNILFGFNINMYTINKEYRFEISTR